MKPYVIKPGDHLKKIAFALGFDADAVWNDDSNSDLKDKRTTGDVLLPGDILYVPEEPTVKNKFTVEAENHYKATVPKVKAEVVLAGPDGQPLSGESYVVHGLGDETEKTTGDDGKIALEANILTGHVEVSLTKRKQKLKVAVGGLDPASEPSGARMRLQQLGFYGSTFAGGAAPYATTDDSQLASALKAFQVAKNLLTSGEIDEATVKALIDAHGS
jgi:hypothetical protein